MVNTGYKIITEQDMNPLSETYGQTRETTVYDAVTCPPGIDFKARYSTTQSSNKYVYCNGETTLISSELPSNTTTLVIGNCVGYIGDELFYSSSTNNTTLRSLTLSTTVTTVGEAAFDHCTALSSVTFVEGLTLIKRHAFNMCTSLSGNITLPNSLTTIRDNAFYGCSSVSSFTLGTGVTYLGANVFRNCTGLNSVTVLATTPPSFGGYNNFRDTNNCPIYVPSGTLSAYETASGWSEYADRIFEYGVAKWIEQSYECELDANDENTGNVIVTELDTNPSSSTYNTTRTRTYEDLTRCPARPSYNFKLRKTYSGGTDTDVACNESTTLQQSECSGDFVSAIIGDCVTAINSSAFYQKTTLTSVIISSSVTNIYNYAFAGCTSLTSVTIEATTPPTLASYRAFSSTNDCPIYVPSGSVSAYQSATGWSNLASRIQAIPS